MTGTTRRDAIRGGAAVAAVSLTGCLGVFGGGDGESGPDLPQPSLGADRESADVVVKAWEDYRCPHCATFSAEVLPRIRETLLGDRVRFEFHDFPLPIDQWSWKLAMAARSVQERAGMAAFWTFAETALTRQREMDSMSAVRGVADEVGADPDTVGDDVAVERHRPVVAGDRQAGRDAGVSGTPAVYVNGQSVAGTYDAIRSAVESEL